MKIYSRGGLYLLSQSFYHYYYYFFNVFRTKSLFKIRCSESWWSILIISAGKTNKKYCASSPFTKQGASESGFLVISRRFERQTLEEKNVDELQRYRSSQIRGLWKQFRRRWRRRFVVFQRFRRHKSGWRHLLRRLLSGARAVRLRVCGQPDSLILRCVGWELHLTIY